MASYHELLFNATQALETRGELEVMVGSRLSNGGDDSDVVTFRADAVGA
jgi:hypothetical protein